MPKAIAASRGRRASGWMTGGVSKCDLATIVSNLSAVGWGLGGLLGRITATPPAASTGDAAAESPELNLRKRLRNVLRNCGI
jgi:hypothetical protein